MNKLIRTNIRSLKAYSSARDEYCADDGVFLDANENPFGTLNRYPDPYQNKLKEKLAEMKDLSPEQIFVGNGSDEVVDLTFRIFCEPGKDKALSFSPSYGMYEVAAEINDIELIKLPLNSEFQMDLKSLEPYLKEENLKLIFICSPNNPTGNVMNQKDVEYILNRFKGILLIDEAYIDFAPDFSMISLLQQYENLIISQTMSKAWGLAGARVGMAFANEKIISYFNKTKPPYNVSALNQEAALKVLNSLSLFEERRNQILEERSKLQTELMKFPMVKKVYDSDANFLLVEVENADFLYKKLISQKIIIRNRNNQIRNCVRITIGSPPENQQLLIALKDLQL
jgi:histidinol-phosphate aminotransferase